MLYPDPMELPGYATHATQMQSAACQLLHGHLWCRGAESHGVLWLYSKFECFTLYTCDMSNPFLINPRDRGAGGPFPDCTS